MKKVVIYGVGALAKEVAWLIDEINIKSEAYEIIGYIDDFGNESSGSFNGKKVLGEFEHVCESLSREVLFVFGFADPIGKSRVWERCKAKGFSFATLIHPSCVVSPSSIISEGSVVTANCVISCDVKVGEGSLLNLSCTIGHDTVIGSFVSVMPGCNVSGNVNIGSICFLGTGAKVIEKIEIGQNVTVGMGSVVVKSVDADVVVFGVPAKKIKTKSD